jgi:hypothetical protein
MDGMTEHFSVVIAPRSEWIRHTLAHECAA